MSLLIILCLRPKQLFTPNQSGVRQNTPASCLQWNGFIEYLLSAVVTFSFTRCLCLTSLCWVTDLQREHDAALCQEAWAVCNTHTHTHTHTHTLRRFHTEVQKPAKWQTVSLSHYIQYKANIRVAAWFVSARHLTSTTHNVYVCVCVVHSAHIFISSLTCISWLSPPLFNMSDCVCGCSRDKVLTRRVHSIAKWNVIHTKFSKNNRKREHLLLVKLYRMCEWSAKSCGSDLKGNSFFDQKISKVKLNKVVFIVIIRRISILVLMLLIKRVPDIQLKTRKLTWRSNISSYSKEVLGILVVRGGRMLWHHLRRRFSNQHRDAEQCLLVRGNPLNE